MLVINAPHQRQWAVMIAYYHKQVALLLYGQIQLHNVLKLFEYTLQPWHQLYSNTNRCKQWMLSTSVCHFL